MPCEAEASSAEVQPAEEKPGLRCAEGSRGPKAVHLQIGSRQIEFGGVLNQLANWMFNDPLLGHRARQNQSVISRNGSN
jgi:hypothetical protein